MDLPDIVSVAKGEVQYILTKVLETNKKDLEALKQDVNKLETTAHAEFPTITYTDALRILKEKEGMDIEWGKDLRTIEEDKLMNHFTTPVVVTHYPLEIMAFYKPRDEENPKTARCFDMLAPGGTEKSSEDLSAALTSRI